MADEPIAAGDTGARCPWCSFPLQAADVVTCPACGATLAGPPESELQLPGVTTLDTDAIDRARALASRTRSPLLSLITGDDDEELTATGSPDSVAPPTPAVRREMLRMEIAAARADLEAEAQALALEERLRQAAAGGANTGPNGASDVIAPDELIGGDEPGNTEDVADANGSVAAAMTPVEDGYTVEPRPLDARGAEPDGQGGPAVDVPVVASESGDAGASIARSGDRRSED